MKGRITWCMMCKANLTQIVCNTKEWFCVNEKMPCWLTHYIKIYRLGWTGNHEAFYLYGCEKGIWISAELFQSPVFEYWNYYSGFLSDEHIRTVRMYEKEKVHTGTEIKSGSGRFPLHFMWVGASGQIWSLQGKEIVCFQYTITQLCRLKILYTRKWPVAGVQPFCIHQALFLQGTVQFVQLSYFFQSLDY